jgi:hypothetical protein
LYTLAAKNQAKDFKLNYGFALIRHQYYTPNLLGQELKLSFSKKNIANVSKLKIKEIRTNKCQSKLFICFEDGSLKDL